MCTREDGLSLPEEQSYYSCIPAPRLARGWVVMATYQTCDVNRNVHASFKCFGKHEKEMIEKYEKRQKDCRHIRFSIAFWFCFLPSLQTELLPRSIQLLVVYQRVKSKYKGNATKMAKVKKR